MAKLTKKFSELTDRAKENLIKKHGSKSAAVNAHSAARILSGKKETKKVSKAEKNAALKIVSESGGKIKKSEVDNLLSIGVKADKISKFAENNKNVSLGGKAQNAVDKAKKGSNSSSSGIPLSDFQLQTNAEAQDARENFDPSGFSGPLREDEDGNFIAPGADAITAEQFAAGIGGKTVVNEVGGTIPGILETTDSGKLDKKVYQRLMPKLLDKAGQYDEAFKSKDYLEALKEKATQRMKITPESYGRNPVKTPFKDKSLAEKYDANRDRLLSNLRKPLTSYLDKLTTNDKSGLNMFTKQDGEYTPVFNKKRLNEFSSTGDLGTKTLQRASLLGAPKGKKGKKRLEGIGSVENTKSSSFTDKLKQDLQYI